MSRVWHWILFAMVFYTIGEYYAKKFGNTSDIRFAVVAWVGYAINAMFFFPAISKYNSLSILGTLWNVFYVIITLFIGIVVFKETLAATQVVGLVFAFIAIILLSI